MHPSQVHLRQQIFDTAVGGAVGTWMEDGEKKTMGNKNTGLQYILKLWNVDVYNLPSDKIILHDTLDVRMTFLSSTCSVSSTSLLLIELQKPLEKSIKISSRNP